MFQVALQRHDDLDRFRLSVRRLLALDAPPDEIIWTDGGCDDAFSGDPVGPAPPVVLPAAYLGLAALVICHEKSNRLDRLYRLAWRVTHGERQLLQVAADPLVHQLEQMRKAVARDRHKMTAFVRFRGVEDGEGESFVAWFEPRHHILRNIAPFFVDRFAAMRWAILTPLGSIVWNKSELAFGGPQHRQNAPNSDPLDGWWEAYYAATFNPARANVPAMLAEMPKRYWHNLPEAKLIPELLAKARQRSDEMIADRASPALVRKGKSMSKTIQTLESADSLEEIAAATQQCQRCPLYEHATQAVPGSGSKDAELMLVGEQPGDREDLTGQPFVGSAGQLLDRALAEAGIDRQRLYITNAVKHFKFLPRGKRRIHQKPATDEIQQCRWWLDRELSVVQPRLIVALGATAARSLLGRSVTIGQERGRIAEIGDGRQILVTVHPSYLLRLPDIGTRKEEFEKFVADLTMAANHIPAVRQAA